MKKIDQKIINILKKGGVGVMPTDTIYGLVGSALSKEAVEKIYKLKKRSDNKPFIILISDIKDLDLFGYLGTGGGQVRTCSQKYWPGPVSVILKCPKLKREMSYLRPFNKTLAFRCPKVEWLNVLLRKTGPLVAPSANPEGLPAAETIKQAKRYFTCPVGSPAGDSFRDDRVDFYIDAGTIKGAPSSLISLDEGKVEVLRKGKMKIKL